MLVQSLSPEKPLKEEIVTCSNILNWKIPWTEGAGRVQSMVSQELDVTEKVCSTSSYHN